ncbi:MAG: PHP-associated domain-containing protein [Lachnospiraceae bacterium]
MRFDLHCHTKNGSIDGRIAIEDYVKLLQSKGFQGMLVTDHNSYKGYRTWKKLKEANDRYADFVVLKGVEYDTLDAGHMIVVMPDKVNLPILEIRGLPLSLLIGIVHRYDGIIGPAHPFGAKYVSVMASKKLQKSKQLIHRFDFIEAFNSCELPDSNVQARKLAMQYHKPTFGGSDSHQEKYVGTAYTDIDADIRCRNDFIQAVKEGRILGCGGQEREPVRQGKMYKLIPTKAGWIAYNRGLAIVKSRSRKSQLVEIFHGNVKNIKNLIKANK